MHQNGGGDMKFSEKLLKQLSIETMPVEDAQGKVFFITNPNLNKKDPRYTITDPTYPGLRIVVSETKIKFQTQKRVGQRVAKFSHGDYPTIDLRGAIARHTTLMADIFDGIDPKIKRQDKIAQNKKVLTERNQTMGVVWQTYLDYIEKHREPATFRDVRCHTRYIENHPIWKIPFRDIKPEDFESLVRPIFDSGKIATGHKIKTYMKSAWRLVANDQEYEGINPIIRWQENKLYSVPENKRRESFLDKETDDGKRWLDFIINEKRTGKVFRRVIADYVILTLIYGTRKNEIIKIHSVNDIDWEEKSITCKHTKNGDPLFLPLTPLIQSLIEKRLKDNKTHIKWYREGGEPWVFPGRKIDSHIVEPSTIIKDASKTTGHHIMLHDLRRTFAGDMMISTSSDSNLVKTAMNHRMATSSSFNKDMTLYYVQKQQRLKILRPIFERREVEIFKLLGLYEEIKPEGYVEPEQQVVIEKEVVVTKTPQEMLDELEKQNQNNPALLAMLNAMKLMLPAS